MASFDSIPRPTKSYHYESYDRILPSKTGSSSKGKTVLVTGGAAGIGLAISQSFAEAGVSRIVIVSRSPGPQVEAKEQLEANFPHVKVDTIAAAITDRPRMEQLLNDVGPIDVLVLNAAAFHTWVKSVDVPFSEFEDSFNTNVLANLYLTMLYLKSPKPSSGTKTLINVSTCGIHVYLPRQTGYGTSKAAFTQALSCLALEHSPEIDGVRIVSFHPGAVFTRATKSAGYTESSIKWEDAKLPGDFAVWLASPEAAFLHGRFVWAQWNVDEILQLKGKIEEEPNFLKPGVVM